MNQSNISKYYAKLNMLSSAELLTILHDCVDILAPVSSSEYAAMNNITKKTVLNRIRSGKIPYFKFDDRKYPIINDHLTNKHSNNSFL